MMNNFRNEDFTLKDDIREFGEDAERAIKELYKNGESLGYDYREICYVLNYLVNRESYLRLYKEEIVNL